MPLGSPNTGGVASQGPITGGRVPATSIRGGIRRQQTNPNVVFILLDDGGAEWFNWSGLQAPTSGFAPTPRLDEMRARGVAFRRYYASPICGPTRARIHSGRYGFRDGFAGNIEATDTGFGFGASLKMIARAVRLGRNGIDDVVANPPSSFTYALGWFGKCHMCSDTGQETYAIDRGWGRYIGGQPNAGSLPVGAANAGHYHFVEITQTAGTAYTSRTWGSDVAWPGGNYSPYDAGNNACWDAYKVWRDSVLWINSRTQPFVAMLTFNPPHAPFEVPPYTVTDNVGTGATGGTINLVSASTQSALTALDGGGKSAGYRPTDPASIRTVYRANIEAIDTLVGMLWDRMTPAIRDNTVFVFLGDNGTVSQAVDTPYDPLKVKRSIYEMGHRAPLVVWGPAEFIGKPGRTCDHLVQAVDILPTIADLCGLDGALWNPSSAQKIDGRSFAPVLRDANASPARSFVYSEIFLPLTGTLGGSPAIDPTQWVKCYSDGTYKLIEKAVGTTPRYEMYRIDGTLQPGSGEAGYFERSADNLYPAVQSGDAGQVARFNALLAAMNAVLAS